jgi:hypothetical protein
MPPLGVQHCLIDFEDNIDKALQLVSDSENYRIITQTGQLSRISVRQKELFASLALLRMHLAWEDYIENVFLRYICGARTSTGYSPTLLSPSTPNLRTASTILLGRNNYLNWSPTNIESRARQFFRLGEPFISTINISRNALQEISTIRNRFAHRSESAYLEFEIIVRNALGFMPRGINSGRFLLMNDPANPHSHIRFIDKYATILRVSAGNIVP